MHTPRLHHRQQGISLIEALVAILIFSMGIIALMGLQAVSITNSAAAKYRSEASFFAEQIISQMWAGGASATLAGYACNPCTASNGNADTQAWVAAIQGGANSLPNSLMFPPSIVVVTGPAVAGSAAGPTVTVTVTVFWLAQSEIPDPAPAVLVPHQYVAIANITKNF